MRRRKKEKKKIALSLKLFYILLVSMIIINFSMSRFKTTYEGDISANTAVWTFTVANSQNQTFTINLGDTVNPSSHFSYQNGVIAPSAYGEFTIAIDCTGCDVAIDYEIIVKTNNNSVMPEEIIFFEIDDEERTTLVNKKDGSGNFPSTMKSITESKSLQSIQNNPVEYVTISWLWQVNNNINESQYEGQNVYIDITVVGKQQI